MHVNLYQEIETMDVWNGQGIGILMEMDFWNRFENLILGIGNLGYDAW